MNIVNWLTAHYVEIFAALFAVEKTATLVVKLTPTPKDDSYLASFHNFLTKVASFMAIKDKPAEQK